MDTFLVPWRTSRSTGAGEKFGLELESHVRPPGDLGRSTDVRRSPVAETGVGAGGPPEAGHKTTTSSCPQSSNILSRVSWRLVNELHDGTAEEAGESIGSAKGVFVKLPHLFDAGGAAEDGTGRGAKLCGE
jgi:hypothetical protein